MANRAGQVKIGYIQFNSFFERDQAATLSINDLMKSSIKTVSLQKTNKFSLKAGVVNHELVNALGNVFTTANLSEQKDLGGEVIAFAIIEKPFVAIDGNTNINFIMDYRVRANYAFSPKVYDAFANALEASAEEAKAYNENSVVEGKSRFLGFKVQRPKSHN